MNNSLVIGLDAGTTSVKAVVFDKNGRKIASAREALPLDSPAPGLFEQDPENWWEASCKALRKLSGIIKPENIGALSISNQRETFVPLDKNGDAVRSAILWLDERCRSVVDDFAQQTGRDEIHKITGKPVDYAPVVYRIYWMKMNEPELFERTAVFCDVHSFLAWKLTGQFGTSTASADPLGLLDMKIGEWSEPVLNKLGISESRLPALFSPGTVIGNVTVKASGLTGLGADTKVIAGGGDGQAAGLGVRAMSPERAYLNLGTAVVCGIFGEKYITDKAFRTMNSCSGSGFYYECSLRAGTFAVDWLVKNIMNINPKDHPDIYLNLEEKARQIKPGCSGLLFLPYICGAMNPYWDTGARGAFAGLSSSHNYSDMYRAVLEGIAFELYFELETAENSLGTEVKELGLIGGGSASGLWQQIISDVTGREICIFECSEASALGAAVCAAVGAGIHTSFETAASEMIKISNSVRSDSARNNDYKKHYERFKKLYPALKDLFQP